MLRHQTRVVRCLQLCGLRSKRQLESKLVEQRDGEVLGQPIAQTLALHQAADGLVGMFGFDEGGKLIHGLLPVQEVTRNPERLPKYLIQDAGPKPVWYNAACSPHYSET